MTCGLLAPVAAVAAVAWPDPPPPASTVDQIREAYADAFNHDVPPDRKFAAIEGGDEVRDAAQVVAANFPEAAATAVVNVYEVVVDGADDTTATVQFELQYSGGAQFGVQVGRAVRVDDRWLVAQETVCMVFGWAGVVDCGAGGVIAG